MVENRGQVDTETGDPWHDLLDVRQVPEGLDPQAGLKEPTYENVTPGETFGPARLLVNEYRSRRFDFIMGGQNAMRGSLDPLGRQLAHPGSFSNELFEIYTLNYSASQIVGVHASEEIWLNHPMSVGDTLVLTGLFEDKYEKRGQGYVVTSAEARTETGELIARRRGTEIMRTIPGDVVGRSATKSSGAAALPGRIDTTLDETHRRVETMSDPLVDDWFRLEPQLVTFEQAALYSRYGEYVTSIHGDLAAAQRAGLKAPIVQGQQQMCLLMDGMLSIFGPEFHRSGHIAAKFIQPVPVFSKLQLEGRVSTESSDSRIAVQCWLKNQAGQPVSVANVDMDARS